MANDTRPLILLKRLPVSLWGFVLTGLVFVLQMIPGIGVILMFAMAAFWPTFLLNISMVGLAMEAWSRDVSRWWLVIPVIYFGGFGAATIHDQYNLRNVASSYGKLNEAVVSGFDPSQHSLVDDGIPNVGLNLVRNFGLRVAYRTDPRLPEGYYSNRLADKAMCDRIRGNAVFREASVSARELPNFGKNNVGFSGRTHGLCYVTMP